MFGITPAFARPHVYDYIYIFIYIYIFMNMTLYKYGGPTCPEIRRTSPEICILKKITGMMSTNEIRVNV